MQPKKETKNTYSRPIIRSKCRPVQKCDIPKEKKYERTANKNEHKCTDFETKKKSKGPPKKCNTRDGIYVRHSHALCAQKARNTYNESTKKKRNKSKIVCLFVCSRCRAPLYSLLIFFFIFYLIPSKSDEKWKQTQEMNYIHVNDNAPESFWSSVRNVELTWTNLKIHT